MIHPLRLYGESLAGCHPNATLRLSDGTPLPVPLDRYLGPPDETDIALLHDVRGPVLDVGCGPGRHLRALAARGVFALGVDLSPTAVELATGRGARAVVASVFDELPGGGAWRTALLLDGNIGIGGDPARLLSRIGALLHDDGELLLELAPPGQATDQIVVRIETGDRVSGWFEWARVSISDLEQVAESGGFAIRDRRLLAGRWFARLRREPTPKSGTDRLRRN